MPYVTNLSTCHQMTLRIIEDHKPLVEDLNVTGQELMEICTDEDASDIKEDVDNIIAKYDDVKVGVRDKLVQLEESLHSVSSEVRLVGKLYLVAQV